MEKSYRNLGYIFLLFIPFTFLGFYKTYFNQFPAFAQTSAYIHIHAVIASSWVLMMIAQPILIRNGSYELHRKVGKLSYFVFPLLITSFIPGIIKKAGFEDLTPLFFPLSDIIMLMILYPLAIYNKKQVTKHMRYMIGVALVFLDPTLGRIGTILLKLSDQVNQNALCILIYIILLGLIVSDKKNGKNYRPYLLILSLWIVHHIVFNLIFW